MYTSKLLKLFKVLNPNDLAAFPKYAKRIQSQLDKEAFELFQYLKRFAPTFLSNRIRREMICRHLFKERTISNAQLNKIAHQLKVLLEDFLVYIDLEEQTNLKEQLLLQSLKRRNAPNYSEKSEQLIQNFDQKEHLDLFLLHNDLWSDINTEKISGGITHFQKANEHLDSFYFSQKLAFILEFNSSKSIREHDFKLLFDQPILKIIRAHPVLNKDITTQLWLAAIQMQQSNLKEDFITLKMLFFKNFERLAKQDAQVVFVLLTNFYNRHLTTDTRFYAHEGYLLYQFAVTKELLLENGRIRALEYSNAATVGFYAGEEAWTFKFLEAFKPKLKPSVQEATYAQVYAYYHFSKGDFELAYDWILRAELCTPLELVTTIKISTLKLRTAFEQWRIGHFQDHGYYQILESLVKSFFLFIKKHPKLPSIKKDAYLTFAELFKRLLRLVGKPNSLTKIDQLEAELVNVSRALYKEWFVKKIKQLRATYPTNER